MVNRWESLVLLAVSAAIALMLAVLVGGEAEALTVYDGDVVVDHDVTWYDDTFEVHGNITVLGGFHLTVMEATVEIVGSANGSHWFNASSGSTLTVDNGTIRGSPHPVGMVLAGSVHMVESAIENVWTSNSTPAIDLKGAATMLRTRFEGCPDSTGMLVTGSLEAELCDFLELGDVCLVLSDPTIPGSSLLRNCTFLAPGGAAGDTVGLSVALSSELGHGVDLTVADCTFEGFTYGVQAFVNTTLVGLTFEGSDFVRCETGLAVSGNGGRVAISRCSFDQSTTAGLHVYVIDPMLRPLDMTIDHVRATSGGIGIYLRGPVLTFRPLIRNASVSGCTHGIQAMGATVLVEDSVVEGCEVCFYVENKARIEIRRTRHDYRSAAIAPAQQAAVVAFSTVEISSCRWSGAQEITEGILFLKGDDGVELGRVDMRNLGKMELVVWSLTRFNDLGRLWVVPSINVDGHEFVGLNFSIYNSTPQDLEIVDHLPPVVFQVWPPPGHWYPYDQVDVAGRLVENGSGLDTLVVRLVGHQERTVEVLPHGNWSVSFDPVDAGPHQVEVVATDLTGGSSVLTISDLHVDPTSPSIELFHDYVTLTNGTLLIPANDLVFPGVTEPFCTVNGRVLGFPDDSPRKCNETVASGADGSFQVQLCPGTGFHTVLLTATDRAGNVGRLSVDVGIDATPPRIGVSEPRPEWDRWYNLSVVTLRANVSDAGASEWFKVWVNGVEVGVPGGVLEETVVLEQGENHIVVHAEDQAGYGSTEDIRILVDSIDPELRVESPVEDVFFTKDLKVNLQGEVIEENLVALTLNGAPLGHLGGLFTAVMNIEEGENRFLIEATDLAGNVVTRGLVITRDVTPPVFTHVASIAGGKFIDIGGPMLATIVGDGPVTVTITFSLSEHATVTASGGHGQAEGEGEVSISFDLVEGENSVTFTLVDRAGNSAPGLTYRITLDTTPPEIQVPGSGEPVRTKDSTHWLRGRVEVGSTMTLDGEPLKVDTDGSFDEQVELSMGVNVFHLEAVDRVGLTSELDVTLVRENRPGDSPGPGASSALLALLLALAFIGTLAGRRS